LSDQHAVEWILVMADKVTSTLGMPHRYRELGEAFRRDRTWNILSDYTSVGQFADAVFCGNLPSRSGAYEDVVFYVVIDRCPGSARKLGIGKHPPEKGVRVE